MRIALAFTVLAPQSTLAQVQVTQAPTQASTAERDCVIVPHRVIDVATNVPGLLQSVSIERSDVVVRGQEIARLESEFERAAVELAEAWASIHSDIDLESINHGLDTRRKERVGRLYKDKVAALDDKDKAETDAAIAEVRLRQAREKRWVRELDAKKAKSLLERRIVRSPIDGVVMERFRSGGEYVDNQPVARIAQLDPLQVETLLPMSEFGTIQAGMQASVHAENDPDVRHTASVSVVDRVGDAASGTFGVRLTLANPDYAIPAGLKCSLKFLPAEAKTVSMPSGSAVADASAGEPSTNSPSPDSRNTGTPGTGTNDMPKSTTDLKSLSAKPQATTSPPADVAPRTATLAAHAPTALPSAPAPGPATVAAAPVLAPPPVTASAAPAPPRRVQTQDMASSVPATRSTAAMTATRQAASASTAHPSSCQAIGPLRSEQSARSVMSQFADEGAEAELHKTHERVIVGSIVLSAPAGGDSAQQHVQRMRAAGVRDLMAMPAGEFGGLVSLGVFRKAAGAERRRAQIAALGFKAEIRTRHRDEMHWWVALHADSRSPSQPTATAELLSGPAGAQMLPCSASEVPSQLRSTPAQAPSARESTQLSQRSTQRQ